MQVQLIIKDTFSILDCSDNKMVKINPNEIQKQKKEKYLHCSLLWSSNDLWLIQEQKMLWAKAVTEYIQINEWKNLKAG